MTKLTGQKGPFGYDEPQYVQKSHICLEKCASTRYSRNQNQTQEEPYLLNLSLKVVISWTCSVLIVGVSRQVLLRSVIPELVHPEGIPSGTGFETKLASTLCGHMTGLNMLDHTLPNLCLEITILTLPNRGHGVPRHLVSISCSNSTSWRPCNNFNDSCIIYFYVISTCGQ